MIISSSEPGGVQKLQSGDSTWKAVTALLWNAAGTSAQPSQSSAISDSSYKIPAVGKNRDAEKEIQRISPSITITAP